MNPILKEAFETEMHHAKESYRSQDWEKSFLHLERAHILGQRDAVPHTINHWWMLKVGVRNKDHTEVLGQIVRIAVAGIGSILGRAPMGNTGGANVGILTPMPIPEDLKKIFIRAGLPAG
ncbi:DUF3703 domain-containing protein [Leptospira idonii]|uniref:DUF3703 domain-containing protein n=1 Tax=Leptospira idonii TaxID=1193500 RepID=A0A4R9LYS9_9LEPT|nr:DUF3703 domain-containing protein [Leptospira idonii]TGN18771.1 DUF3703 domain-containing protein [Leptospira idonii]